MSPAAETGFVIVVSYDKVSVQASMYLMRLTVGIANSWSRPTFTWNRRNIDPQSMKMKTNICGEHQTELTHLAATYM